MTSRFPLNERINELVAEEDSPRRVATPGPSAAQLVLALRLAGGPKMFELRKQRNEIGTSTFIGITCPHESLSTLLEVDIESINEHILNLSDTLISRLELMGRMAYVAGDRNKRGGIISIRAPNADEILLDLAQGEIEVAKRQGLVRLSPLFYNTEDEIAAVVENLKPISLAENPIERG